MAEKVELRAAHAAVMDTMETRAKELDRRHALGAEQLSSLTKAEASARELLRQELSETGNYDAVLQVLHICAGIGLTPCPILTGTGLAAATSAPGRGSPLPRLCDVTSAPGLGSSNC